MKNKSLVEENIFFKIVRVVLGLVFIFSSFVKGVDPLGTAYRVEDYLIVYQLDWLIQFKLALSILLITVEFVLGFALLFKLRYKITSWATLLIMIFFTLVTWFDARDNLVPDCGCFGDAVKLTNWQTFYKNIVLLSLAMILLFAKKNYKPKVLPLFQYIIILFAAIGFVYFQFYNLNHLPIVNFRVWKEGKDMRIRNLDKQKIYLIYKNKETGETKEYLSPNYPWNDSVWMSKWEFLGKRIDDSQVIRPHFMIIEDENGNDVTQQVIENPGYQLLVVSWDMSEVNGEGMIEASRLAKASKIMGFDAVLLTATDSDNMKRFIMLYQIEYPVYYADDVELKAMIRSNPGLLLLHKGVILKKWHYNDIPSVDELKSFIK
jgi:energy-coupling factor transporter transmembrane protein EcfT